jgi:hypothetical protein
MRRAYWAAVGVVTSNIIRPILDVTIYGKQARKVRYPAEIWTIRVVIQVKNHQLASDRVTAFEPGGRRLESALARHGPAISA